MSALTSKPYLALVKALSIAEARVAELKAELDRKRRAFKYQCGVCSKKAKIGDTILVREQQYHPSYSSYEDPYWTDRSSASVNMICPHCHTLLYTRDEDTLGLLNFFKVTARWYPENRYQRQPLSYSIGYSSNEKTFSSMQALIDHVGAAHQRP